MNVERKLMAFKAKVPPMACLSVKKVFKISGA
jgi:hypothetical protein